jgi:secreted PhoX family phosphatase
MLTLDDLLDSAEPHATFERATVRAMTIDYERGRFVADIDLRVGDPGAGDEDARERLRRGRLTVEGLRMWALEPPERTHRQRKGLVLGKDYGPRSFAYDTYTGGGTTSLEVEPHGNRRRVREHWSLVGTMRNCAGAVTPWGSWLTCEETFESPSGGFATKTHGFVFEVPVDTQAGLPADAKPLTELGRFNHEAAGVDPATGIIYLTEDQGDGSGLYRYVPPTPPTAPGQLANMTGGKLQMLKVATEDRYIAAIGQTQGVPLPVTWVDIPNPTPSPSTVVIGAPENLGLVSGVFNLGYQAGGAVFRRLEGCWFDKGRLFFNSTNGGDKGLGQIWVLNPAAATLTLVFESDDVDVLDACDNITVTPRGGLIVCEDNGGMQILRGIAKSGEIFDFAKNIHNNIEFAGACFSPDGQTLFVNLFGRLTTRTLTPFRAPVQIPLELPEESERAMTLAIWGPWRSGLL